MWSFAFIRTNTLTTQQLTSQLASVMLGCHVAVQEERNHMAAQQPDSQPVQGDPQFPFPVAGDTQWRNVYFSTNSLYACGRTDDTDNSIHSNGRRDPSQVMSESKCEIKLERRVLARPGCIPLHEQFCFINTRNLCFANLLGMQHTF